MKKIGIQDQLDFIKEFQIKYPESHIGGSIGIYLHGIDLKRDLSLSDVDITSPDNLKNELYNEDENIWERSDPSDFDHSYKKILSDGHYFKIDIRISPEPSFDVIDFEGIKYNVSKLRDIIFWKKKYANKGIEKHLHDLMVVEGKERPEPTTRQADIYLDDLPF